MKQDKTTLGLLAVILFLFVLVLSLGGFILYIFTQMSPGQIIGAVETTPSAAPTIVSATLVAPTARPSAAPTATTAAAATAPATATTAATEAVKTGSVQSVCGNTGTMTILFVGAETGEGTWPQGADAVRLIKVDFDQQAVSIVAFPRDLWLNTPHLANLNMSENRLGLTYYFQYEIGKGTQQQRITDATSMVAQNLYDNFGTTPETYFTLQMSSLAAMIDEIGGVPVDVPYDFISDHGYVFKAGTQVMDGRTALEFIRTPISGEAARLQRQNRFVKGLQARLLSASILPHIPELISKFSSAFVTNLSPEQLVNLACMVGKVPESSLHFYQVDGDLVQKGANGALLPRVELIKARLLDWLGE